MRRVGERAELAEAGRRVLAVDIAEAGLVLLDGEARRRQLRSLLSPVQADLAGWAAREQALALVVCTGFWDRGVFTAT